MPENTLPAFAIALSIGVDALELDVGMSADNVVVVSHDPLLNPHHTRGSDGAWLDIPGPALRALTAAQIETFDVGRIREGTGYREQFLEQRAVDGTPMPTLEEVILLVNAAGNRHVHLNIELKSNPGKPHLTAAPDDFADAVIAVLRRHEFTRRATVQSFDWRVLQRVQSQAPEIRVAYLTVQGGWLDNIERGQPGPSPWSAGFDVDEHGGSIPRTVKAAGGDAWAPAWAELEPSQLREAHELGLAVLVWTVNDPGTMQSLIGLGVDGIITDYPNRLREVMQRLGMRLTIPTPVSVP